jgi:hypothetical protein
MIIERKSILTFEGGKLWEDKYMLELIEGKD